MRRLATLLAASTALAFAAAPAAAQEGWGLAPTDVAADETIRYGVLDNGMKYAIMPNDYRPGQAAVRMHVDFGAVQEAENERGLAHFIEHMAFNGTTNVAEGEMISMLERLGLAFGADTNASTGFDRTIYMLDLPQVDDERLDAAFFLMRETASEIQFDEEAVNRERGVILGERRTRNNWQLRNALSNLEFFLPDAPYADRSPIGTEEVLTTATGKTMRDLYHRYYRPEYTTFVFVGDVDPDAIERRIRETFADWDAPGNAGAPIDRGSLDLDRPAAATSFADPAAVSGVTIRTYRPDEDPADTLARRRESTVESWAVAMFNNRMQRIAEQPDSIILGGGVSEGREEDLGLYTSLNATVRDGEWESAIGLLEQEARRAVEYGFSEREFERVKRERLQQVRTYAEQSENRTHAQLANQILGAVGENYFITAPAIQRQYIEQFADTITLEEANAAFAELFAGSEPLVYISGKEEVSATAALAALENSRTVAVAANEDTESADFAYADWGAAGSIASDTTIEDLGIRTITFDNGVRLNLKTTDFQDNAVSWSVSVDGGSLLLGAESFAPTLYAQLASGLGGTNAHPYSEIDEYIAGRPIGTGFTISETGIQMAGSLAPEFLPEQMRIAAAYLTDYGYREEADARWANIVPLILPQLTASPASVFGTQAPGAITGGDPRFVLPDAETFEAFNADILQSQIGDMLSNNAVTVSVVGAMDEDAVIAAVANTFGTLDRRGEQITDYTLDPVTIVDGGESIELTHEGEADQALIAAYWPTDDDEDFEQVVGLSLLRAVMDLELTDKVREELGASYGVGVSNTQDRWYEGYGNLTVQSVVDPAQMDATLDAYREVAASLRASPVDADTLQRARAPIVESRTDAKRSNGYWLGYANLAQRDPARLDRARNFDAILAAVTAEDLQALAQRYLTDDALIPVRITSSKLGAE
ncbi:insulinase family protein [Sphingomicrobium sp. XHP0239]|uniref:M16 family metallopeptidase n=1 Tax=Sphingomicrobium maritimum TaxID=3133972 RepID=UPI0031CC9017